MRIYTIAKKCFLAALLIAGTTFSASAQKYSFYNGKAALEVATTPGEEVSVHLKMKNISLDTFQMTWQLLENTFSANDWDMVAMCDPYLCHNDIPSTFSPFVYANTTADSITEFKALATPKSSASVAHMKLVVFETANPDKKDTITLTIDARALSINNASYDGLQIASYPNPAKNTLMLGFSSNAKHDVKIYDLNGATVLSAKLSGNENQVNVEKLPAGLYILKAIDANGKLNISKFNKI
jgi:hypothetical protein